MALYFPASTWSRASDICKIPRTETFDGITLYVIEVNVSSFTWTVKHRYSDFSDLHDKLVDCHDVDKTLLPPKKIFGSHSDSFISKRQAELELYLQTLLHRFNFLPLPLKIFLEFHVYEIRTIIENLCEKFYFKGDTMLSNTHPYQFTPLELHAINERLKLAEPTCTSGEKKHDLGHLLSFVSQLQHLKVIGSNSPIGSSNIVPNNLTFSLGAFKSLKSLLIVQCKLEEKFQTAEPLFKTLTHLKVHESLREMSSIILAGNIHWHPEDPIAQWPYWLHVTSLDLSHNFLTCIHPCAKLLSAVESIDLSHNDIQEIENLESLPRLSHLNLAYNQIQHLAPLHTRLGNVRTLIFTGNKVECLQGLCRLFSLVELHLIDNCIMAMSEISYVGKLPCLEKLTLSNNPISNSVDYRAHVLLAFGSRAAELFLDGIKTSEKEVDTVAVLQALQVAKKEQFTPENYKKICPTEKIKAMCWHSCSEFKHFERICRGSGAVSKFRQEVATLRKLGGTNWLRLLNQMLDKTTEDKLYSDGVTEIHSPSDSTVNDLRNELKIDVLYRFPYTNSETAFPAWVLSPGIINNIVRDYLYAFIEQKTNKKISFLSSSTLVDFLWLIYAVHQCISITQIPMCVLLFPTQILMLKIDELLNNEESQMNPKMSYYSSFSSDSILEFMIGPCKSYIELHVRGVISVHRHLFFMPNSDMAGKYIDKLQDVYKLVPSFKKNPFVEKLLNLNVLRSDKVSVPSEVQCQLLFCRRIILLEALYGCSANTIHYLAVTPSHIVLVEETLPLVTHNDFHACMVVNTSTNVANIQVGNDDCSWWNANHRCDGNDALQLKCAKDNFFSRQSKPKAYSCGPRVYIEFASSVTVNIRFLCIEDQNLFLDAFLHARSV